MNAPDLILHNGAITTLDPARPQVSAVAITGGRIAATGGEELLCRRRRKDDADRPERAAGHPRPQRLPHPRDPGRPQLQHGTALGRRAVPGRRPRDAPGAGAAHPAAPVGAGDRRLDRVPVCRTAHADPGGDQPGRARHAGLRPASLRPRHRQRGGAARPRLYPGDAQPARRGNPARQGREPDRAAHRQAERHDPLRQPGQGAEALPTRTRSIRPATSCAS